MLVALLFWMTAAHIGCATPAPPVPDSLGSSDSSEKIPNVYDPWELMNRHVYRFNANFDKYVFLPVIRGYRFVLPQVVRTGISNVFSNIGEATIIVNSILQLSPIKTANSVTRLMINSTFGIAGIFDVATLCKLPGENEDFGQTLGFYGVGPGPFLVLPILGPSSVRDTSGLVVDTAMTSVPMMIWVPSSASPYITGASTLRAIQARDDLSFRYGELGPFEYNLIRALYLENRVLQIDR
jgi:phospholipid-binding lipoprotein MlaA